MAFSVAYHDLLDKNIRHIYSSLPSNVRFRCDPEPRVILNANNGCVTSGNKRRPTVKVMSPSLYRRLWTYSTEFGCPVPRAPALRSVSPARAQVIVDRVSQLKSAHHCRRRVPENDDDASGSYISSRSVTPLSCSSRATEGTQGTLSTEGTEGSSFTSGGSTSAALDSLTERMMRPTIAWNIRSDLREGSDLDPVKVVTQRTARRRAAKSAYL